MEAFRHFLESFHPVPAEDWQLLSAGLSVSPVKEGAVLLREGKIARELYFICDGILRLVKRTPEGEDITMFFLKENKCAVVLDSFSQEIPSQYSLEAACDAMVIALRKDYLLRLYEEIPYLRSLVDSITQQGLLEKIHTRNAYMGLDATRRYQHFLEQEPDIVARVPLSDIASFLGITQQSLSRIRKNLHT
ncbi:Crp/Fnr family transcriptional regulator [Chitinophaga arvensicola]|uniref:cAMP-binding domain of CRP or a regulatory subunit of cAMP-dependent protein kinases n=1 Tax=Chitinophaga arvensicola TaxID=29529 RepID=A0A1I0RLP2_9BACT|nr:Crp/Fnr family transcriptional regulator [Chitinophaga arvensicola]SEW42077.1 cAMP-binding domain of CRP or a regulatory subunit of cAMP-dependent protein kinases [Chitinophaga arvensicola]